MTAEETKKILAILKAAYPNSYKGMTRTEAIGTVNVWASQFARFPASVVLLAVNKLISVKTFPPSINEVKERIRGMYWESWQMLDSHKRGLGDPLAPEKVAMLEEIMSVAEPMICRTNAEPTLDELMSGFSGYLSGDETAKIE